MNERHPIDDLFARYLRSAEAEPPKATWDAIVRQRDRRHLALLLLRRRWGLLLAALLLCGAAVQWALPGGQASEETANTALPGSAQPRDAGTGAAGQGIRTNVAEGPLGIVPPPPVPVEHIIPPVGHRSGGSAKTKKENAVPPANLVAQPGKLAALPIPAPAGWPDPIRSDPSRTIGVEQMPTMTMKTIGPTASPISDGIMRTRTMRMVPGRPLLARPPVAKVPEYKEGPSYVLSRTAWWVALEMGEYRESRAWRGGDPRLAQALNGTETAHSPWSIGILGGMEGRNGWGISIGLGYNAAHYDFHHVDRILSRNDSLVPYVITFNSQVIASYMDTVTTFSEERHPVAAMNRYSLIRVPIEVSWHRPWRRWQYGLRAGLSAEFNTMISGITLVSDGNESGTRSVDVASDLERRTNALLTGSVAADLGYALTDRWALWASPTVAIGLLPLSHASDAPYAMPDRLGMRLRLSYSFREHR